MTDDEIREELLAEIEITAKALTKLCENVQNVEDRLYGLVVQADQAEIPKLQISKASGLARNTVYAILLRHEAGR